MQPHLLFALFLATIAKAEEVVEVVGAEAAKEECCPMGRCGPRPIPRVVPCPMPMTTMERSTITVYCTNTVTESVVETSYMTVENKVMATIYTTMMACPTPIPEKKECVAQETERVVNVDEEVQDVEETEKSPETSVAACPRSSNKGGAEAVETSARTEIAENDDQWWPRGRCMRWRFGRCVHWGRRPWWRRRRWGRRRWTSYSRF